MMDYDKAYTDRCKCGEPATIEVDEPYYIHYHKTSHIKHYCIKCYARKKANESIKQLTGVSDD